MERADLLDLRNNKKEGECCTTARHFGEENVLSDGNYVYLGERTEEGVMLLRPLESIHVQFPKLDTRVRVPSPAPCFQRVTSNEAFSQTA